MDDKDFVEEGRMEEEVAAQAQAAEEAAAQASAEKVASEAGAAEGGAAEACAEKATGDEGAGAEPAASADPAALEAALAEEKNRNVRLYADFENFRRRMERERLETWSRAEREFLADLLPIADNFDRAMSQAGDDPFSAGVKMVHASLLELLKKRDVTAIESVGKPFNPAVHEAVAYQPSPDSPEGTVIYETRKGYKAGEAVLRPASVIVSSGAPEAARK